MVVVIAAQGAMAASTTSSTVVTAEVLSATSIDVSACLAYTPGVTEFGQVLPGSDNLTATGANVCSVDFGSSNDTSRVAVRQADGEGTAFGSLPGYFDHNSGMNEGGGIGVGGLAVVSPSIMWRISHGRIEKTTNGGASWVDQGASGARAHIAAFSATHAVSVGWNGEMTHTVDGTNWVAHPQNGVPSTINGIDALATGHGWIGAENQEIWHTTDSGVTWTQLAVPADATGNFTGVDAIDNNNVVIASQGDRPVITNTATTFTEIGGTCGGWENTAAMASASVAMWAYATRGSGRRYCFTDDGGSTSTEINIDDNDMLAITGIAAVNATTFIITDEDGNVLRTTNAGASHALTRTGDVGALGLVRHESGTNYIARMGEAMWSTPDSGVTWSRMSGPTSTSAISGSSPGDLWAVGGDGDIRHSTDGLVTWSTLASSPTANALRAIDRSGSVMVAVGNGGTIIRSSNGGNTWATAPSGVGTDLMSVEFGDASTVWAGGRGGVLLKSIDAGASWAPAISPTAENIRAIAATSATNAFLGSYDESVYQTTNGTNWVPVDAACCGRILSLHESSSGQIAVAGEYGQTYSDDNGGTWPTFSVGGCGVHRGLLGGYSETGRLSLGTQSGTLGPVTGWTNQCNEPYLKGAVVFGDTAYMVGDSNQRIVTKPQFTVADYSSGVTDWTTGSNLFGMCLQAVGGSAVNTWTVDAAGTAGQCETNDADPWNPVLITDDPIATTATPGDSGSVDLVYGFRAATNEQPGELFAPLVFSAVAPNV